MEKKQRIAKKPVEKLQAVVSQMDSIFISIIDSAESPEFLPSLIELKKNIEKEESINATDEDVKEITKLLQTYPGLSKQILGLLRSKITEYKALEVIDKYKAVEKIVPKIKKTKPVLARQEK